MKGYYKLSWRERTGYCSGELALNRAKAVGVGRHLMPLLKKGPEAVAARMQQMTEEMMGVMARTGVKDLEHMDPTVIHKRMF